MMEDTDYDKKPNCSRRPNKHLVEKKRRDRINTSLNQLKSLVLQALNKEESKYSKLEKADILEMTVRHLKGIQRNALNIAASSDPTVVSKYRAGYSECAGEVTRYLSSVDSVNPDVRGRLLNHLASTLPHGQPQNTPPPHMVPMATPSSQPIQVQIPQATHLNNLPGSMPILQLGSGNFHGLQTVTLSPVSPAQTHIMGTFQIVPSLQQQQHQPLTLQVSPPQPSSPSDSCSSPSSSLSVSPSSIPASSPPPLLNAPPSYGLESSIKVEQGRTPSPAAYKHSRHHSVLDAAQYRAFAKRAEQDIYCGKMKSSFAERDVWRPW